MADRQPIVTNSRLQDSSRRPWPRIIGERFGRLVVQEFAGKTRDNRRLCRCDCDCGKQTVVRISEICAGKVRSCGCLIADKAREQRDDLTGRKFGRLTVISYKALTGAGGAKWLCRCDCGQEIIVGAGRLTSGNTQSCGCLHSESASRTGKKLGEDQLTHGQTGSLEYNVWRSIKVRCHDPRSPGYRQYGARGIIVCDRWRNSFELFLADMGYRPTPRHTIDRFPNKNGNYEPGNCRWATMTEQHRNKNNNALLTYRGKTQCAVDWAHELDINKSLIYQRRRAGWSDEAILTVPPLSRGHRQNVPASIKGEPPADRRFWKFTSEINRRKRISARTKVYAALKNGTLKKAKRCQHPGCVHTAVEAHHHLGYEPEHALDVKWYCRQHHANHEKDWSLPLFGGHIE